MKMMAIISVITLLNMQNLKFCNYGIIIVGLPPPQVDLSKIIKAALGNHKNVSKLEMDLERSGEKVKEAVEKATKHPKSKRKRVINLDHSDFNMVTGKHEDEHLVATNIEHELKSSTTKGLEQLKPISRPNRKAQTMISRVCIKPMAIFCTLELNLSHVCLSLTYPS